jgi:hypothetical protein
MIDHPIKNSGAPPSAEAAILLGAVIAIGLTAAAGMGLRPDATAHPAVVFEPTALVQADLPTPSPEIPLLPPAATFTATPRPILTPTPRPTHTPAPTPTLDLSKCNAAGCGANALSLPTVAPDTRLLLRAEPPARRLCPECPPNEQLTPAQLNALISANPAALARLQTMALSQQAHQLAPGIVYIVFNTVHHVVVDLHQPGFLLRNIIPHSAERGALITPSFCASEKSLVVVDADYHGLNGSNKTETGRDLFFHLGRAALFERDGRFDLDVIRERADYDRVSRSWGGGPIFLWEGEYNFNPEQEWFEPEVLEYYRTTRWAKMTVAVSEDRKYLFLSVSYDLSMEEHAQNIIELGRRWGITVDRAMRFDGGESAYLALRLDNRLVPVLNLEEPLIVNCLAIEAIN